MNFYLHALGRPKNLVDADELASRLMADGVVHIRARRTPPRPGTFVRARTTNATATRLIARLA